MKNDDFTKGCDFVIGASKMDDIPPLRLAEVAFTGRSNVGKSSLLNAMVGRKDLARVSNTPGRTQQLNFFNVAGKLLLVDMPGYGYAKASKKDSSAWNKLIRDYLKGRAQLRRVIMLIDARHGVKDNDEEIMKMLDESAVTYQLVLTKADKVKNEDAARHMAEAEAIAKRHAAAHPRVILTSAETKTGLEELRYEITTLVNQ